VVTLTILNFNGADTLRASIQSVLDQTTPPDRFLVIDNASTDESYLIAEEMGVEIVWADNKHKFITGLNTAMNINKGILFFMQNDVVLEKDCLFMMLHDRPSLGYIAQPIIYQKNGDIDNAGMDYKWPGYGERRHKKWWSGAKWQECGLVTTICFMTDIKDYRFDELFSPAYYEDIDFYLRTEKDIRHVLIPSASATHLGNHTFSQSYKKAEISRICWVNRGKLIRKHYRGLDRWIRLLFSFFGYLFSRPIKMIFEKSTIR